MKCQFCGTPLDYVHGHGTCLNRSCLFYGQNQAPCCDGATVNEPSETKEKPPQPESTTKKKEK